MFITILVFMLILTILVLIHEAGHFFVAKKLGIKVEEFGFGLPPRIWGIKKGETLYSINLLPIGGFVKLYGEDDAGGGKTVLSIKNQVLSKKGIHNTKYQIHDTNLSRAFYARPVWQRALVVIAGVVMNFFLAVLIITYFFGVAGVQTPGDRVFITDIVKGSPAEEAQLQKDDIISEINGVRVTSPADLVKITKQHLGEKINLKIERKADGEKEIKNIQIVPRKSFPSDEGPMGVGVSSNIITQKYPLWQAPFIGLWEALKFSWLIVAGLAGVFYQILTSAQVPKGVAGPVGIAQLTGQFVAIGPLAVLSFVSLLSLNLAILNILPIPALDGGRLFFILIEAVTGRKVSTKFESMAHAIGMAILLALIALITLSDIIRWIKGQPILPRP